jgi:hypothetical protein
MVALPTMKEKKSGKNVAALKVLAYFEMRGAHGKLLMKTTYTFDTLVQSIQLVSVHCLPIRHDNHTS